MWRHLLRTITPPLAVAGADAVADTAHLSKSSEAPDSPKLKKKKRFDIGKYKRTHSKELEQKTLDDNISERKKQLTDLQVKIQDSSKELSQSVEQRRSILELYERQIAAKKEEQQRLESEVYKCENILAILILSYCWLLNFYTHSNQ